MPRACGSRGHTQYRGSSWRLDQLIKLDARVEANIDALRLAEQSGWSGSLEELAQGAAGEFFVTGVLVVESGDSQRLDQIVELAYARAAKESALPYHPAYDPWRGLVSALAWAERAAAGAAIVRLLDTPRPRTRWLGFAGCGARRMVRQNGLEAGLVDAEPLVRARALRTIGELGRSDLRARLNALLADPAEDCRFWAAWSAARLGTQEGLRALAEFGRSPGPWCEPALEIALRRLPVDRANAFLRTLAGIAELRRVVIRATAMIGDALYLPWLIGQTGDPGVARSAGAAFAMITGAEISRPDRPEPAETDEDPNDEQVIPDENEGLAWPDPAKCDIWWQQNKSRFTAGTAYYRGRAKSSADWIRALHEAPQNQRQAAALELALRQSEQAMFNVRARGDLQRRQLTQARGAT